jgi:hypothetical protein
VTAVPLFVIPTRSLGMKMISLKHTQQLTLFMLLVKRSVKNVQLIAVEREL